MTDREQINSLTKKVYDYAVEICELKQENYELKQQIAELENSAKDTNTLCQKCQRKRKFMTVKEYCEKQIAKIVNIVLIHFTIKIECIKKEMVNIY